MSIKNDIELNQTLEQITRFYRVLAALRRDSAEMHRDALALLAEAPLAQIRELQAQVDEYLGIAVKEPVWLRIIGAGIEWGNAPASVLTSVLDTLRKGVQAVAEVQLTGELTTRPTAALRRACEFRIFALAPGSLRVGVHLTASDWDDEELEMEGADEAQAANNALRTYLQAVLWAAGRAEDDGWLESLLPDPRQRKLVLTHLLRFVPSRRGDIECVEVSSPWLAQGTPVRLVPETRERISRAIDRMDAETTETHIGYVREIDLDRPSFVLRNPGGTEEIRCEFADELLDTAKEALDRRVRVTGTRKVNIGRRRRMSPLQVTRMDFWEDEEP